MKKVAFIVAGVQKAGTSTLFSYLSKHPELGASDHKEPHFFDDESIDWANPDYTAYHRQFVKCGPDSIWFEATPIYLFWPPSLARIAAYNPAMKLVLIFRDPVQRAFSQWRMARAKQSEKLDFGAAIREGRNRLASVPPNHWNHKIYSYVERGFYASQLERALTLFPPRQLLCLAFDSLQYEPDKMLARIADFLGTGMQTPVVPERLNAYQTSQEISPEDVSYLRDIYRSDTARFKELTGIDF